MILCLYAVGIPAQQNGVDALARWFAKSESRELYRPIEGELMSLFREADAQSFPYSVLIDRLNLGAARGLRPERLLVGMQEELARLATGARIIDSVGSTADGGRLLATAQRADLLNTISIYLTGGLSASLIEDFLTVAARSGKSSEEVFRGCAVLLTVERVGHFSDDELLDFGSALVGSELSPSSYPAVGSLLVRAAATGRGGSAMLRLSSQILRQGGGLPQMELELRRRR